MVEVISALATVSVPARNTSGDVETTSDTQITNASPQNSSDERKTSDRSFDDKALDKIAQRLVTPDSRLAISQDESIRRFIYKFVNKSNGDVIRQYPHPRVLESMHAMEEMREHFLDTQA